MSVVRTEVNHTMLFRLAILVVMSAAVALALSRFWRVIAIGSAYKSKVLASTMFGVPRAVDPDRAEEVSADSYWVLRLFRTRVDVAARSVTASFLGLRPRSAVFR